MIVNADSISIPLAPKSVHCTITSTPYWGLRDYGLPPTEWPTVTYTPMAGLAPVTVQGCDPGCAHEWGDAIPHTKGTGGHNPKQDSNHGSWQEGNTDSGSYCQPVSYTHLTLPTILLV